MTFEQTILGKGWMPGLRGLGVVGIVLLVAASGLFGTGVGIAAADDPDAQITDITISDREDVDGDGYVSSFQVTVEADTEFPEVGGLGKGNPVMEIQLHLDLGGTSVVRSAPVGRDRDGTFIFEITGDEVYAQGGGDTDPIAVDPTFSVLTVGLFDADVLTEEKITSLDYVMVDKPLKIEQPANDTLRDVTITSNVDGADVYLDGERQGQTPWTGTFAVDHARRYGETTVEVREEGYRTASKQVPLDSSTVQLTMAQRTKPVIVVSEPDNATVYVDGRAVGQTPWVGEFWVERSRTIRVEKSGYFTQEFTNVSAPRSINATLVSTDQQFIDFESPELTIINASATNDSSTSDNDTQVVDVGDSGSSTITTGSTSLTDANYLPSVIDDVSVLDSAIHANVSAVPGRPSSSQSITFDGLDSYSLFGSVDSYRWSFGDGATASGQLVTHSYASPGTYEVELTVEDTDGFSDTVRTRITVADRDPSAVFVSSRGSLEAGQQVTFDGSGSSDPEGPIASYEWDFGDGTVTTGSAATHRYAAAGVYDVTLTVTDQAGQTETVTRSVTVRTPNQPPTAAFDASEASPTAGTQVEFDASDSADADGQVQAYGWEFGDGSNATGKRVTHQFANPGTYTVKLSVRDDRGEVRTTTSTVEVAAAEAGSSSSQTTERDDDDGQRAAERAASSSQTTATASDDGNGVPTWAGIGAGVVVLLLAGFRLLRG